MTLQNNDTEALKSEFAEFLNARQKAVNEAAASHEEAAELSSRLQEKHAVALAKMKELRTENDRRYAQWQADCLAWAHEEISGKDLEKRQEAVDQVQWEIHNMETALPLSERMANDAAEKALNRLNQLSTAERILAQAPRDFVLNKTSFQPFKSGPGPYATPAQLSETTGLSLYEVESEIKHEKARLRANR